MRHAWTRPTIQSFCDMASWSRVQLTLCLTTAVLVIMGVISNDGKELSFVRSLSVCQLHFLKEFKIYIHIYIHTHTYIHYNRTLYTSYGVQNFTGVRVQVVLLWVMARCILVDSCYSFRWHAVSIFRIKMETACSSETSAVWLILIWAMTPCSL
jgi:hypothetical protein